MITRIFPVRKMVGQRRLRNLAETAHLRHGRAGTEDDTHLLRGKEMVAKAVRHRAVCSKKD